MLNSTTLAATTVTTTETTVAAITTNEFVFCTAASLVLGLIIAFAFNFRQKKTKSFMMTLALLPVIVQVVIMLVNGNIGTGVAVMGAFSLVRFRSVPGTAKEIGSIFLAMAVGLACGMGYPLYALIFAVIMGIANIVLTATSFGESKKNELDRVLHITVPEDLEYAEIFDDIFAKYLSQYKMIQVKTTNLGSLNKLTYNITLGKAGCEKQMIDELRCRNGNLEINITSQSTDGREQL